MGLRAWDLEGSMSVVSAYKLEVADGGARGLGIATGEERGFEDDNPPVCVYIESSKCWLVSQYRCHR